MDYLVICLVALFASGLTLISGFGLGTLLLPAFAFFFPLDVAVGLTAIVHLVNNVFKLWLVGLKADRRLVVSFGLPALVFAFLGALVLGWLAHLRPIAEYELLGHACRVTPVGVVVAALMFFFALMEVHPGLQRVSISPRLLPLGGAASGFFGGISGHQGALRSAFLLRFRGAVTQESFIATNVVIAVLVDVSRLGVYGASFSWSAVSDYRGIVLAAIVAASLGAWLGARLMKKITMRGVQLTVSVLLVVVALGLGSGVIG